MTVHAINHSRSHGLLAGIGRGVARFFDRLLANSPNVHAAREAQRLWAMSDAELAAIGIPRDQILYRTLGPRIWL